MKVYSERLFLKYLFSNHGVCFGVDLKDRSYLFLVSKAGGTFQRRPVGDKVVENLDYEIPEIVNSLGRERLCEGRSSTAGWGRCGVIPSIFWGKVNRVQT